MVILKFLNKQWNTVPDKHEVDDLSTSPGHGFGVEGGMKIVDSI